MCDCSSEDFRLNMAIAANYDILDRGAANYDMLDRDAANYGILDRGAANYDILDRDAALWRTYATSSTLMSDQDGVTVTSADLLNPKLLFGPRRTKRDQIVTKLKRHMTSHVKRQQLFQDRSTSTAFMNKGYRVLSDIGHKISPRAFASYWSRQPHASPDNFVDVSPDNDVVDASPDILVSNRPTSPFEVTTSDSPGAYRTEGADGTEVSNGLHDANVPKDSCLEAECSEVHATSAHDTDHEADALGPAAGQANSPAPFASSPPELTSVNPTALFRVLREMDAPNGSFSPMTIEHCITVADDMSGGPNVPYQPTDSIQTPLEPIQEASPAAESVTSPMTPDNASESDLSMTDNVSPHTVHSEQLSTSDLSDNSTRKFHTARSMPTIEQMQAEQDRNWLMQMDECFTMIDKIIDIPLPQVTNVTYDTLAEQELPSVNSLFSLASMFTSHKRTPTGTNESDQTKASAVAPVTSRTAEVPLPKFLGLFKRKSMSLLAPPAKVDDHSDAADIATRDRDAPSTGANTEGAPLPKFLELFKSLSASELAPPQEANDRSFAGAADIAQRVSAAPPVGVSSSVYLDSVSDWDYGTTGTAAGSLVTFGSSTGSVVGPGRKGKVDEREVEGQRYSSAELSEPPTLDIKATPKHMDVRRKRTTILRMKESVKRKLGGFTTPVNDENTPMGAAYKSMLQQEAPRTGNSIFAPYESVSDTREYRKVGY